MLEEIVKQAKQVFDTGARLKINGEYSNWLADNIEKVIKDIYPLKVNEKFSLADYAKKEFGEDGIKSLFCAVPYLTGANGLLNLYFESKEGDSVDVKFRKDSENKQAFDCFDKNGKKLTEDEVLVVFKRNERV